MPIVRQYTDKLWTMLEDGAIDKDLVITACLKFMSEDDVKEMMLANEFIVSDDEDDEYDED